ADLRGRTDEDCVKAMLAIADSRFQEALLHEARRARKIDPAWAIPPAWRGNTPERLDAWLAPARRQGLLPPYPFGTDFDEVERQLLPALARLGEARHSRIGLARLVLRGLAAPRADPAARAALQRLSLLHPETLKDRATALALRGALATPS